MGTVCGVDKYKQIREAYGLELTKMVIGEKNKLFLDRMVNRLKKEISEYAEKSEGDAFKLLRENEAIIDEFYDKVRTELEERQPGGVKSLQQMTGKTAEDLLGYSFIKHLLAEFRENLMVRFKQQQNALLGELFEIKLAQEQLFEEEKPNMSLYNDMESDEKETVLKRGEMEFHDLVVKYEEYILSRYGHKLDMEYYISRFNSIDPRQPLENLRFLAKDKFVTSLNLILSQKINSYILFDES